MASSLPAKLWMHKTLQGKSEVVCQVGEHQNHQNHINVKNAAHTFKYEVNSLYTEFHFLQVLLRLLIPCMSRIFTSAMS